MDLSTLQHRYHTLRRDFEAGRIDAAVFAHAVDRLGFQDGEGRYWQMGIQSGAWYCYDGQQWQPADPWTMLSPVPVPELRPKRGWLSVRSTLITTLVSLLILAWLVGPVAGAPFIPEAMQTSPVPTPTIAPLMGNNSGEPTGAISGSVVDLSSGQPGVNIGIAIGEAVVHSDTNGNFSLTGLDAGTYKVSPLLDGQGTPAQGPVFVNLDGQSNAIVNLAYYSQTQPLPTDTPQVIATETVIVATPAPAATPPALPAAGAPANNLPLALAGLGLGLTLIGLMLKTFPLSETAHDG